MIRRQLHRVTFALAGVYNILWGVYAVLDPQWFFRITGLPLSNTPQIFATLGMVLGLYGILYLEVARVPERGWLVGAIGLTGKILGPGAGVVAAHGSLASKDAGAGGDQRPDLVGSVRAVRP